jgi:hypothetical protein
MSRFCPNFNFFLITDSVFNFLIKYRAHKWQDLLKMREISFFIDSGSYQNDGIYLVFLGIKFRVLSKWWDFILDLSCLFGYKMLEMDFILDLSCLFGYKMLEMDFILNLSCLFGYKMLEMDFILNLFCLFGYKMLEMDFILNLFCLFGYKIQEMIRFTFLFF